MLGRGKTVASYHFMKTSNRYGELHAAGALSPDLSVHLSGPSCRNPRSEEKGFVCDGCMKCHVAPGTPSSEDIAAATAGLAAAAAAMKERAADLVILDEVGYAVSLGLLEAGAVAEAVKARDVEVEAALTEFPTANELREQVQTARARNPQSFLAAQQDLDMRFEHTGPSDTSVCQVYHRRWGPIGCGKTAPYRTARRMRVFR